jgi:hypothetical protein
MQTNLTQRPGAEERLREKKKKEVGRSSEDELDYSQTRLRWSAVCSANVFRQSSKDEVAPAEQKWSKQR